MVDELRGFRISSGRRARRGAGGAVLAFGMLLGVLLVGGLVRRGSPPPTGVTMSNAVASPTATVVPSTPTPPPGVEHTGEWQEAEAALVATASPTPWPTLVPAPRRPEPTPTLPPSDCVTFTWSAGQSAASPGNVLVEIRTTNRCRRELDPLEVFFVVSGWRDGDLVQTARGHPFEPLRPGTEVDVLIALPGSIDWYDRITVDTLKDSADAP